MHVKYIYILISCKSVKTQKGNSWSNTILIKLFIHVKKQKDTLNSYMIILGILQWNNT